jgi:hypothetical protein
MKYMALICIVLGRIFIQKNAFNRLKNRFFMKNPVGRPPKPANERRESRVPVYLNADYEALLISAANIKGIDKGVLARELIVAGLRSMPMFADARLADSVNY